jgi:hypothetical protein
MYAWPIALTDEIGPPRTSAHPKTHAWGNTGLSVALVEANVQDAPVKIWVEGRHPHRAIDSDL